MPDAREARKPGQTQAESALTRAVEAASFFWSIIFVVVQRVEALGRAWAAKSTARAKQLAPFEPTPYRSTLRFNRPFSAFRGMAQYKSCYNVLRK